MATYVVKPGGERLDRIAKALYGSERGGTVEALLDANPGLAKLGFVTPAGTVLQVPAAVDTPPSETFVLAWE